MRLILALCCLAAPALAETCPPAPDHSAEVQDLLAQARAAPDETAARPLTARMWELWTDAPDTYAQELLDEGMDRRASYDFAGAMKALDALVDYCPDYAEGYNQRAFVHFLRQDHAPALDNIEQALDRNPDHLGALIGQALVLMHMGRVDEGQAALREAVRRHPWIPERAMLLPEPGQKL
ncbi:tetratricopeptide (TPR) repeat protein [Rhodovulum iodosum]|uniref:Tetratricopeptide (TPR) repeat protein n=1 Tax=Rhodovulum iodosum TaxID=68291 RepID=A0ABV3XPF0_9RHOB|nr:tetratricopeptide repeat protein [Rhodovulum robiginosum]RSK31504.1 hypothetical protein EJA01_15320 [Rhodovulum robiginosum]